MYFFLTVWKSRFFFSLSLKQDSNLSSLYTNTDCGQVYTCVFKCQVFVILKKAKTFQILPPLICRRKIYTLKIINTQIQMNWNDVAQVCTPSERIFFFVTPWEVCHVSKASVQLYCTYVTFIKFWNVPWSQFFFNITKTWWLNRGVQTWFKMYNSFEKQCITFITIPFKLEIWEKQLNLHGIIPSDNYTWSRWPVSVIV